MDKKELVDLLLKKGYEATLESNIPMVKLKETDSLEALQELIKKEGYDSSYGYFLIGKNGGKAKPGKQEEVQEEILSDAAFMAVLGDDDDFAFASGGEDFSSSADDFDDSDGFEESSDGQLSFF